MIKKGLAVAVILLFIGMCVVPLTAVQELKEVSTVGFDGNTLYVGGNGTGNYTKIQDAIDNSSHRDTVFVYRGTYYENLIVNKSINLIGEDRNNTIINNSKADEIIKITANGVYIKNFTIKHDTSSYVDGILIKSSNNTIDRNNIINNYQGIIVDSGGNFIQNNFICSNEKEGITIHSNNNIICGNNISNNTYYGIHFYLFSDYNIIMDNKICSNGYPYYGAGITSTDSSNNFIIGNTVAHHHHGAGYSGYGLDLHGSHHNIIYHNNIYDNKNNVIAFEYNKWHNGISSGGNYWGDYKGFDILPPIGIGDIPYRISGLITDRYPLMEPYEREPVSVFIYYPKRKHLSGGTLEIPFPLTILLQDYDVKVYASDYEYDIEKVEFYIDNKLKATDETRPYSWRWIGMPILFHNLKVVAYNTIGETGSDEIKILKIPYV